jgi:predicted flap endonuclease-1-like 5' DNA nuclease
MTTQDTTEPTEYTPRIGKVARRELAVHGYTRYDQLTGVTTADLLRIHGVGPKAVRILEEELTARGLAFATP